MTKHSSTENQNGLLTMELLRILSRRRIWLTWSLKLIGPQTLLYSIPTKKEKKTLPLYILRDGSPRPRLSKPQPAGWWSIFAVLLERSHSCLSLCCLWPYSKQDNSLPKIPTCRIWDTLPNKGGGVGAVKVTLGNFPTLLCYSNVTTIAFKNISKTWASSSHTDSRLEKESNH